MSKFRQLISEFDAGFAFSASLHEFGLFNRRLIFDLQVIMMKERTKENKNNYQCENIYTVIKKYQVKLDYMRLFLREKVKNYR